MLYIFIFFALIFLAILLWLFEVNIYFRVGAIFIGILWITVERYRELKKKEPVFKIVKRFFVNVWDILQGM